MTATHRVKDSSNHTIGFIIENNFFPDYFVRKNINDIDNLSLLKDNRIRAEQELPVVRYADAVNKKVYRQLENANPFYRDIQSELLEWKNDNLHVVLQLEGSRQVGKTTELQKFAYKNYEFVVYINIANDKYNFLQVLKSPIMVNEMQQYCERALLPRFINNKNTILIIDEIQNSAEVYNSIRDMHAIFECDIVVTGSYLGRILGNREFFLPAGTIQYKQLMPLSFREFCRIYNVHQLLDSISLYGESEEKDYKKLEELFFIYIRIGGYPEVIKQYTQTHNVDKCYDVIDNLLKTFKEESRNYFTDKREVEIFENVYREALKEMCNEKKGTGNNMVENITRLAKKNTDRIVNKNEVANAVIWLRYTGIINTCDLAINGDINDIASNRRIYFSDCGLVSYLASKSTLDKTALTGLISETFVYNELHRLFKVNYSKRLVRGENVCFSTHEKYELDFMVMSKDSKVYGIEVKTVKGNPVSLKVFIDKHFIDRGVVAKPTCGGKGDVFDTIPIYTVGCRFPYNA